MSDEWEGTQSGTTPGQRIHVSRVPAEPIQRVCPYVHACTRDEMRLSPPGKSLDGLATPLAIRPGLTLGQPGDHYEREADEVAERVMRMPAPAVQRKPFLPDSECRTCGNREGDVPGGLVRRKESVQDPREPGVPLQVQRVLQMPGEPLDGTTRRFFETRFGHDLRHIRIHTDRAASDSARTVHALAFTLGSHIVFGQGQYRVDTSAGKRIVAHELAHSFQQGSVSSRVHPGNRIIRRLTDFNYGLLPDDWEGGFYRPRKKPQPMKEPRGGPCKFTIYVEPSSPISWGHAFFSIESETGKKDYYGFYPAKANVGCTGADLMTWGDKARSIARVPGIVCDDATHAYKQYSEYRISVKQYNDIRQYAERRKKDPGGWGATDIFGDNCCSFAIKAGEQAGLSIPSGASLFELTACHPDELGKQLTTKKP